MTKRTLLIALLALCACGDGRPCKDRHGLYVARNVSKRDLSSCAFPDQAAPLDDSQEAPPGCTGVRHVEVDPFGVENCAVERVAVNCPIAFEDGDAGILRAVSHEDWAEDANSGYATIFVQLYRADGAEQLCHSAFDYSIQRP